MNDTPIPVAFIGLGLMGGHMAGHILAAGHPLHVYNRTRAKADGLVARRIWHDDPGSAAAAADVVITIVGLPQDVEEVYLGAHGIIARARPRRDPDRHDHLEPVAREAHCRRGAGEGLGAIDAPVSGGDIGARDAKLSIMIGGEEADVAAVMPILQLLGTNIRRQGGPGAGQHTKLANQIVIAGTMLGVAEGLAYAGRVGLDANAVLASIGTGAAGSFLLNMLGPRMVKRDFAAGFFVEHLIKDLRIARDEFVAAGLDLKGLITALGQYTVLAERGGLREGTQALIKVYD